MHTFNLLPDLARQARNLLLLNTTRPRIGFLPFSDDIPRFHPLTITSTSAADGSEFTIRGYACGNRGFIVHRVAKSTEHADRFGDPGWAISHIRTGLSISHKVRFTQIEWAKSACIAITVSPNGILPWNCIHDGSITAWRQYIDPSVVEMMIRAWRSLDQFEGRTKRAD